MSQDDSGPLFARFIRFTEPGHFPFFLGALFLIFAYLYRALNLPQPTELMEIGRQLYDEYGLLALLSSSFIEGVFALGFYLPGSFVILLSVYLSPKTLSALATIAFVSVLGFLMAAGTNYWLGRYGFYQLLLWARQGKKIEEMQRWLDRSGLATILVTAVWPNSLAVATVCMGIAREGLLKTLVISGIGLIFWIPIWTTIAATVLPYVNIEDPNQHWYIFGAFVFWGVILIAMRQLQSRVKR
jgi:membrane protein DedA with SNARE-associated domain